MTPDRSIVKKLKAYDKNLFVRWNESRKFFELWMKRPMCSQSVLITPITQAIYNQKGKPEYVELDDRIVWWVWAADSHRWGGAKQHALTADSRFKEFMVNLETKQFQTYRDLAKDTWFNLNAFYATKEKTKNGKPKFNNFRPERRFTAPDIKLKANKRSFARSAQNARAYNYRKPV